MTRDRRGFTLVELIVVAVLGTLVIGATMQILVTNQRTYNAQSATVSQQQSNRMAMDVLFAELRELSAADGDIIAMSADSIRIRLMRKFGAVCATSFGTDPVLRVLRTTNIFGLSGSNMFTANDSVFVFADNEENNDNDDVWFPVQVTAVDTSALVLCPQDLTPAADLTFGSQQAPFLADSVGIGAPVRSFQTYTFGTAVVRGDTYMSRREGTGDMIPVAGPIQPTNGLVFSYFDENGNTTATPTDVRQINVIVRTGSDVLNSLGELISDSISVWVYTRN